MYKYWKPSQRYLCFPGTAIVLATLLAACAGAPVAPFAVAPLQGHRAYQIYFIAIKICKNKNKC